MNIKLKKSYKILIVSFLFLLIAAILILGIESSSSTIFAEEIVLGEDKIFSTATINDSFAEDSVLVVLKNSTSINPSNYTTASFNEINVTAVDNMTVETAPLSTQLSSQNIGTANNIVSTNDYRPILKLTLAESGKEKVLEAIDILETRDDVYCVEPDYYVTAASTPNDFYYSGNQWALHSTYGINAPSAWDYTTGSSDILVGVMDTGISYTHPDLQNRIDISLSEDFSEDPNSAGALNDTRGHGTHVAGIIGAQTNNYIGISGVCWDVSLVSLKIKDSNSTSISYMINAVNYAKTKGIHILNCSFRLGASDSYSLSLTQAVQNFGGLFVCSAGNKAVNNDETNYILVNPDLDNVITVGAINSSGNVAYFSNYGAETVSIFAPGQSIISTYPLDLASSGYYSLSGTSMAAPFVTGVAALAFSKALEISPDMPIDDLASYVKTSIIESATDHAALADKCVAGGYLNAPSSIKNTSINKTVMSDFGYNGSTFYWNGAVDLKINNGGVSNLTSSGILEFTDTTGLNFTLETVNCSNLISEINGTFTFELKNSAGENMILAGNDTLTSTLNVSSTGSVSLSNNSFVVTTMILPNDTYTLTMTSYITRHTWSSSDTKTMQFIVNKSGSCVAEGTLITLADGSLKAVEDLTGNEELLVWNLLTGNFDTAPILFIDSDPESVYEVIKLTFSDGTVVEVIDEHAFWDFNLNKYVFLRADASQYIGHWFNKQTTDDNNNLIWTEAQLISVNIVEKTTSSWSPVTYGHLCYYVNGMLSMPGATEGLINIFDVDPETLSYDEEAMEEDIETYGLFTYAEFSELFPVSQTIFNAFNAQYLKVAIGKGLITLEEIGNLIELYSEFF